MKPLRTIKIMQPLGTKKSHNVFGQKNHATSWDKKLHNHLGEKIMQSHGGKNHATSQDKKISGNLSGQNNHATS